MKELILGLIAIFVVVLIIAVPLGCLMVKEDKAAYAAWCKQTDNPKQLTFEEWRVLKDSTKQSQSSPVFIYTPR